MMGIGCEEGAKMMVHIILAESERCEGQAGPGERSRGQCWSDEACMGLF